MPRIKSWSGRIPVILQHLDTDAWRFYTRPAVEVLFEIGRSQATDLMHIAGAVRDGVQGVVTRENLRYYVGHCPEAVAYLTEQDRKRKLANRLQQSAEELRQKAIPIPGAGPEDEWTRWEDLGNVALELGLMRITFHDYADLMHTLWMISRAMTNGPEAFRAMCADPQMTFPPCGAGDRAAANSPATAA
jgi:hypothetical protein